MSPNKVSAKTVFLVAIAAVVFITAMFYVIQNSRRSRAALGPNGVTITMTPATGTVAPNTDQVITVKLTPVTGTYMMSGFDLTFNATGNLQIVSASKPATFADEIFHNVTPTSIRMARTVGASGADQAIAEFTITVKGTGNGTGALTLDATRAEVVGTLPTSTFQVDTVPIVTNYTFGTGGNPTATNAPNPTATNAPNPTATTVPGNPTATNAPNPTATNVPGGGGNATLNIKIKFQGIPKKPANASAETVTVKLRAEGQATATSATGTFTPDDNGIYNGTVNIAASPGANYTIYVKGPRHLQKKVCVNSPSETSVGTYRCGRGGINITPGINVNTIDLSKILLMVGDLPQQDGIVDAYDTSFIRQSFGSTDANKLTIGDLNRDNIVDTQDMSLIIQSLNVKYDEE